MKRFCIILSCTYSNDICICNNSENLYVSKHNHILHHYINAQSGDWKPPYFTILLAPGIESCGSPDPSMGRSWRRCGPAQRAPGWT